MFDGYSVGQTYEWLADQTHLLGRQVLEMPDYVRFRRFLTDVYNGEPWVGSDMDGFRHADEKTRATWREGERIEVLLLQVISDDELATLKESIRAIAYDGKHVIHTADDAEETRRIWEIATRHVHRLHRPDESA
jgi:hypothetical protein